MSKFVRLVYDFFKGMSSFIAPEKLPKTVLEVIENMELMTRYGNLKKRRGYGNIITTGLTTLKAMFDLVDSNSGRQLVVQDGTAVKESVYTGGAYGAVAAITNDKRTSGSTVDQMYPIEYNKELRSPAGIGSNNYRPFIYQYIAARNRFNDEETIAAGKYLGEQFLISNDTTGPYIATFTPSAIYTNITAQGLDQVEFSFYYAIVLDGYIKTAPKYGGKATIDAASKILQIVLESSILDGVTTRNYRITDIDIFIAPNVKGIVQDVESFPAYFLERVSMNDHGDPFIEQPGTFEDANPPTYIEFDNDYADWEPGSLLRYYIKFTHSNVDYEFELGTRTTNVTKSRYAITGAAAALQNVAVDAEIMSGWTSFLTSYFYYLFYDNYYKKLRSEMFTYLNIPTGDFGLDDYKHKYGTIAAGRYFGFGFADGFGYYSPPNAFDVLCAQNVIIPIRDVVGCAKAGRDVYMFYKNGGSRVSVLSNTNVEQDDNFFDVGLVHQKALFQLSDDEFAFMSYKGPYLVRGRQKIYIGQGINPWFERTEGEPYFTDAQKEACVVGYNHLKELIFFSFPTYTTSPYTYGVVFVFDIRAHRAEMEPWWVLKSDLAFSTFCVNNDLHLLAGFAGAGGASGRVVDFNASTANETVSTRLVFNLLKAGKRQKMLFHRLYLDIDTDDTVTINAYYDESATPTALSALNTDNEVQIGQMKQSMKLEISTAASANDVELSKMELKLLPRPY